MSTLGFRSLPPRLLAIQYYFSEDQVRITSRGMWRNWPSAYGACMRTPGSARNLSGRAPSFAKKFHWDGLKEELYKVIDEWPAQKNEAA